MITINLLKPKWAGRYLLVDTLSIGNFTGKKTTTTYWAFQERWRQSFCPLVDHRFPISNSTHGRN